MVDKITGLLLGEFASVYCNSCAYGSMEDDTCDYCSRKNMNWSLSEETAEAIATDIVNLIFNEINEVLDKE